MASVIKIYALFLGSALLMFGGGLQGLLLYTLGADLLAAAAEDVTAAVAAGALRVGDDVGVPLHHYPLEETAAAHDAVEAGAVGKVLIDVAADPESDAG